MFDDYTAVISFVCLLREHGECDATLVVYRSDKDILDDATKDDFIEEFHFVLVLQVIYRDSVDDNEVFCGKCSLRRGGLHRCITLYGLNLVLEKKAVRIPADRLGQNYCL